MTKPKIQTMIYDSLFEITEGIEPEMNILKIVFADRYVELFYEEYSQGLKTTLNHMLKTLDRIGFIYLHGYCEEIKQEIDRGGANIVGADGDYIVDCFYDGKNKISTFFIQLNRWLK